MAKTATLRHRGKVFGKKNQTYKFALYLHSGVPGRQVKVLTLLEYKRLTQLARLGGNVLSLIKGRKGYSNEYI